jgi:antitoxin (DNA-binding transcriptional repressor) of toxin-antitoxin stability system
MEQVSVEEAQARLAELLTAAVNGETIIIVGANQAQFQLLPLAQPEGTGLYIGSDGRQYYRGIGQIRDEQKGVVYYPNAYPPTKEPRRPGSAAGLIEIADDFDAPLEEFREYME